MPWVFLRPSKNEIQNYSFAFSSHLHPFRAASSESTHCSFSAASTSAATTVASLFSQKPRLPLSWKICEANHEESILLAVFDN